MTAPGTIGLREVPKPTPDAGQVLLRIRRIGVCGSDVHVFHGMHPFTKFPVVQGHEFSASVEAVGNGVHGLKPGMKATAMPQLVCKKCSSCRRGDYHICDHLKVQGFQAPGCAQEWFVVPAENLVPLPEDFTWEQGAMVEPTAVAVHAVGRAGDVAGKNVVVFGAGPIGNLVAQVAQAGGAKVLITDLSPYRLEIAQKCGLHQVSLARQESLEDATRQVFGPVGFDVALECVGVKDTLTTAVKHIAKGGTIVVVGVFAKSVELDVGLIQDRELNLRGSLMYKREDYEQAIELISAGKVRTQPLESEHFSLRDYLAAYELIKNRGEESMKVFIDV